jgi:hypothetical protein
MTENLKEEAKTIVILESKKECQNFFDKVTDTSNNAAIDKKDIMIFTSQGNNESERKEINAFLKRAENGEIESRVIITTLKASRGLSLYREAKVICTVQLNDETELDQLFGRCNRRNFVVNNI